MIRYFSPLRYPGGKAKLAPLILSVVQSLPEAPAVYVEPFAGGAGVALRLLLEEHVEHIVVNDLDKAVYSFWRAVREVPERVVEFVRSVPLSIEEWRRQRRIYLEKGNRYSFELGMAAFYLNRTNRSGILSGGPIGGSTQNSRCGLDARFNRDSLAERIVRIAAKRNRITVYNQDVRSFIRRILPRYEQSAFVYFDPPYYGNGQRLYQNALSYADHLEIADMIAHCVACPWMVTYDDHPVLREIYGDFPQYSYSLSYTAAQRKHGCELAIFRSADLLPNLKSVGLFNR